MTQRLFNCGIIIGAIVTVMAHETAPLVSAVAGGLVILFALAAMVVRP